MEKDKKNLLEADGWGRGMGALWIRHCMYALAIRSHPSSNVSHTPFPYSQLALYCGPLHNRIVHHSFTIELFQTDTFINNRQCLH